MSSITVPEFEIVFDPPEPVAPFPRISMFTMHCSPHESGNSAAPVRAIFLPLDGLKVFTAELLSGLPDCRQDLQTRDNASGWRGAFAVALEALLKSHRYWCLSGDHRVPVFSNIARIFILV